ncbi:hypothetical protein BUE80_DR002502 [Diplocarpon rosae]|nr:hypothetical protein BUE80_DR002502 [Diplocarpon rosae]
MRLLNCNDLELEEFFGTCPPYAILSHRWQDDEVSIHDMKNGTAPGRAGNAKIERCCLEAIKHGLQYAWIDTCCIDKSSSAELTEAINSMYRWYEDAKVCFVYLFDVDENEVNGQDSEALMKSRFAHSTWWSRGWTLQELIAPSVVEFYNSNWEHLGSKHDLVERIATITGIHRKKLEGADLECFSIAQRMSWASKRKTTRIEDVAYSLLGIFGVNMPMLYGEGKRAFLRLQEEIMKHSNDHSLFAWSCSDSAQRGLLARSPTSFQDSNDIVPSVNRLSQVPYAVTNFGLSISLAVLPWAMDTYFAALDCETEDKYDSRVGIYLRLLPEKDQAARVSVDGRDLTTFELSFSGLVHQRHLYVRQRVWVTPPQPERMYGFWVRTLPPMILFAKGSRYSAPDQPEPIYRDIILSRNTWDDNERLLLLKTGERGTAGRIWYESNDRSKYTVFKLGFDDSFNPICFCTTHGVERSIQDLPVTDNHWIEYPVERKDGFLRGYRTMGLREDIHLVTISISKEVFGGQNMWVVDIHPSFAERGSGK